MDLPDDTIRYILLFLEPLEWARSTSRVCRKLHDIEPYCWARVGTEVGSLYKYRTLSFVGKTRSGTSEQPSHVRQQRIITSCRKAVNNPALRLESSDVDGPALEHVLNRVDHLKRVVLVDCPFTFRPTTNPALFRECCPAQARLTSLKISHTYFTACGLTLRRLLGPSVDTLEEFRLRRKTPFACSFCGKKSLSKYQKCARCFLANYCSKECQLRAWNEVGGGQHGVVCRGHAGPQMAHLATARTLSPSMLWTIIACKKLRKLDLSWMFRCSDTSVAIIARTCQSLRELRLNGCTGVTDAAIGQLVDHLPDLESLEVRMCRRVTHVGVTELARGARNLQELDLCRCYRVTNESLRLLADGCPRLRRLNVACGLRGHQATWAIEEDTLAYLLEKLPQLEYLAFVSPNANNENCFELPPKTQALLDTWRNAKGEPLQTQIFPEPGRNPDPTDDEDEPTTGRETPGVLEVPGEPDPEMEGTDELIHIPADPNAAHAMTAQWTSVMTSDGVIYYPAPPPPLPTAAPPAPSADPLPSILQHQISIASSTALQPTQSP